MPTYEYECKSCGHTFEVFQGMTEPPLKDCPQCGRELRRLIHGGTGVIFKGSGFYVTDKKGGGSSAAAPPSAKPPLKGEAGETPKGEAPKESAPKESPKAPDSGKKAAP